VTYGHEILITDKGTDKGIGIGIDIDKKVIIKIVATKKSSLRTGN